MDRTPLHIATELGHTSIVETLIDKYRAGISGRTKDGSTLIHIAASHGHPETALAFLRKGVPLHMPNKVCNHIRSQSIKKLNRCLGFNNPVKRDRGCARLRSQCSYGRQSVISRWVDNLFPPRRFIECLLTLFWIGLIHSFRLFLLLLFKSTTTT